MEDNDDTAFDRVNTSDEMAVESDVSTVVKEFAVLVRLNATVETASERAVDSFVIARV